MLKLQQLEISGFKSFVEPTKVAFSGSINAIVGPNGCGKSNLADAITWVLGEQSAKTLRGGKMEDVIFGGSDKRRPLGMAEVTLALQSPDESLGNGGRITIGRRVFRSGESRYTLNGKTVRLRDIKDLLMDTGLGIRTYSVIEQGKIDLILSGKPQERRRLLEEAAGVTRYKARRRLAELKLEEATANLLRLDDILAEVERALRSLKRQASAARRFQRREEEYKELLERVLLGRAGRLSSSLSEKRTAVRALSDEETGLATGLVHDEATLAEAREHVDRLSRELAERHQQDADLAATIEGRQEFLRGATATREEIARRLAAGEALHARQIEELELFETEKQRLETQRIELLSARSEAEAFVAKDSTELVEADRGVRDAEQSKTKTRDDVVDAASRLSQLRIHLQEVSLRNEKSRYRKSHLDADLEQKKQALAETQVALADSESRQEELDKHVHELEDRSNALDSDLQEVLEHEARGVGEKRRLEDLFAADRQRRILLQEISEADLEQRSDLVASLEAAGLSEVEFLGDRLQALEGWESSLDEFLGDLADAALVPAGVDVTEVATRLVEARKGATLLAAHDGKSDLGITDPAIVSSLGEALGLPSELAGSLPPAFLVEDIDDAVHLARQHPGIAFLSRRGPWARAGILRSEGASPQPGLLARSSELVVIAERQEGRIKRLAEIETELAHWVARRTQLAARGRQLQEELSQNRQQLAVTRARREDLGQRHARISKEMHSLVQERGEIESAIAESLAKITTFREDLGLTESRHQQMELAFETANQGVDHAKTERESLRTDAASRRGQLEVVGERLRSHDQHLERVSREMQSHRGQIERWLTEKEAQRNRREQLELEMARSEENLQVALERRAASQEAVLAHQEQLDRRKEVIRQLEEKVGAAREQKEAMQGRLETLRVQAATLMQEEAHLGALFAEQLRRPLPEKLEAMDEDELADLEADLATQKEAIDRVGPVNVLAAQEYGEQEERHVFLTEQRADVSQSVESLKATIKEINETSSGRFKETFEKVNRTFGEVFAKLFRGGEAEMRLLDEDDILESGIEIQARPPGKRPQNMMLLSGGEKALTALALLFALFHTKPTPFCILDEVDAPLDDVNTLRFVELLESMASKVQFLVITHNKLTMESASSLYGVTMQERGVSKLVSVELDEVQPGDAPN